jgi:hypothetical protein
LALPVSSASGDKPFKLLAVYVVDKRRPLASTAPEK